MQPEDRIIFETTYWYIKLMPKQLYLGRSVVVLKRQCGDLAGLNQEEILDFAEVVKKLESALRKTFNATMFNWGCLMNNAYQETPADPQVHWHFRPRYDHPVEFAGQTFADPNFGHHYLRLPEDEYLASAGLLNQIGEEIKGNLKLQTELIK